MKKIVHSFGLLLLTSLFGFNSLQANYNADKLKDYTALVNAWNDAHNNWQFKALENLYTDRVLFYGGTMTRQECISYKTNLATPTKIFVQKVVSEITATDFGKGIIKCSFKKEVIIDDKKAEYPAYLILKETEAGLKIVCESDEITDASFGFELTQDLFQPKKEGEAELAKPEEKTSKAVWYSIGSAVPILIIVLAARRRKKKEGNS
jgi:ketosteroid isomerase-like protein